VVLAAWPRRPTAAVSFLLKNVTVHPVSGPKLDDASVLVVDGRIVEVGTKIAAPKTKVKVVEGKGLHVWPGMINSGSTVGMSEIGSIRESNDTGELGMFDPQLRPIVAMNPESEHIAVVRANGITMTALLPAVPGGRRSDGANAQLIAADFARAPGRVDVGRDGGAARGRHAPELSRHLGGELRPADFFLLAARQHLRQGKAAARRAGAGADRLL